MSVWKLFHREWVQITRSVSQTLQGTEPETGLAAEALSELKGWGLSFNLKIYDLN